MKARQYQNDCVEKTFQWWENKKGFGVEVMPTASGKTVTASLIIERYCTEYRDNPILFLAHRKELIEQTEKKLLQVWPDAPVGCYAAGLKRREVRPIIIASRDTLAPALKTMRYAPSLVMIDEAHNISPNPESRYQKMFAEFEKRNPNFQALGFTATPFRSNHGYIYGPDEFFSGVPYEVKMRTLLDNGWLAPLTTPRMSVDSMIDTSAVSIVNGGDFHQAQLAAASSNMKLIDAALDEWEVFSVQAGRRFNLFFCVNIDHALLVQAALRLRGYNFPLTTGSTPQEQRDKINAQFLAGQHMGMLNVGVYTEGTDFPLIDCIVNLRAINSLGLWLQVAGRGMRLSPDTGKTDCVLLDFGGCVDRFGPIDIARPPMRGDPDQRTKDCPDCGMIVSFMKRQCDCGHEFSPTPCRVCPLCSTECATSASSCAACGHVFFDHEKHSSKSDILSSVERWINYPVTGQVEYVVKRSRKTNSKYIELIYTCGSDSFKANLMLDNEGYAKQKGLKDFQKATHGHIGQPGNVDEALALLRIDQVSEMKPGLLTEFSKKPISSSALREVKSITIDTHDKYKKITAIIYSDAA